MTEVLLVDDHAVIREALASYVVEQQAMAPADKPLLGLIGLGSSAEAMNLADGADEALLEHSAHPIYGWGVGHDGDR